MSDAAGASSSSPHPLVRVGSVLLLLFVFLLGVKGLGDGFKLLGRDLLEAFFETTANPFIGLIVGVLATTLVQSSSVSTSMIVGLVAAPENPLPLANAVLGTRYYKRIGGHVLNVLSSVVMPLHKVDYDDEDEIQKSS